MDQESKAEGSLQERYQYCALDDTDVRCIQLNPTSEHIQGYLTSQRRLDGGYTALSYEWALLT